MNPDYAQAIATFLMSPVHPVLPNEPSKAPAQSSSPTDSPDPLFDAAGAILDQPIVVQVDPNVRVSFTATIASNSIPNPARPRTMAN